MTTTRDAASWTFDLGTAIVILRDVEGTHIMNFGDLGNCPTHHSTVEKWLAHYTDLLCLKGYVLL